MSQLKFVRSIQIVQLSKQCLGVEEGIIFIEEWSQARSGCSFDNLDLECLMVLLRELSQTDRTQRNELIELAQARMGESYEIPLQTGLRRYFDKEYIHQLNHQERVKLKERLLNSLSYD